ncbi:cytochrome c biogenesis protein CcsA [Bythopirellula polymerisocia]|uniref:Cytochrome C assembly protein n=1 Tax=Bythopirellula polymerisocia TaxID=2528003 RepID=A0A5C6CY88_9BACT|nr:cytochrome c biogenesis protein CcsA [Bythopirellula polymerisocia]TWU29903.1 Cytochrome C assembly protein [Bythopirellula polymerisocia]
MDSGINIICFSASYAVALALEIARLWVKIPYSRALEIFSVSAGIVAQTWYLGHRVARQPSAPLSSQQDWFLLAAWVLAVVYLAAKFYYPEKSLGLFQLPGILALIGASVLASTRPLAPEEAPRVWGLAHGVFLLLGTVAVIVGFFAGIMYLLHSHRLKRKLPPTAGFRLPSLEWLERANGRSLGIATLMMCGGLLTGVVARLAQQGSTRNFSWSDPVVASLTAMTVWLVACEAFRILYPAARRGRKVAYLTVAAFVFLVFVLAAVVWGDRFHTQSAITSQSDSLAARCMTSPPPGGVA